MSKSAFGAIGIKGILATTIVAALIGSTFVSIAAANGMASITVEVEFRGPREMDASRIMGQLLTPEQSGGYGYGGAYDPAGYGYGYSLINWLQEGYGYASFDVGNFLENGTLLTFDPVPVGTYRVQVWYDLNNNSYPDEGFEPIAFAETGDAPEGADTLIAVQLGDQVSARAVLAEAPADFTGIVVDQNGAPVPGATVAAMLHGEDTVIETLTGTDGSYSLGPLPTGLWYDLPYTVQASLGPNATLHTADLHRDGTPLPSLVLTLPETGPTLSILPGWNALPVDLDADGLFDIIRVNATVQTDAPVDAILDAQVFGAGFEFISGAYAHLSHAVYDGLVEVEWEIPGTAVRAGMIDPTTVVLRANLYDSTLAPETGYYGAELASDSQDFDLGLHTEYAGPALELGAVSIMPADVDGDGLFDHIEVLAQVNVSRPTTAAFYATIYGENYTSIPSASDVVDFASYDADTTIRFEIAGSVISASGIDPRRVFVIAVDADSATLDYEDVAFDGGLASQYELPAIVLTEDGITIGRALDASGRIETLHVNVTPVVNDPQPYRFSVILLTEDYGFVGYKYYPEGGLPETFANGTTVAATFTLADLGVGLGDADWNITRVQVAAYSESYDYLTFAEIHPVTPALGRADFAVPLSALELPAPESADIEISCGPDRADCLNMTARPATGWTQLNVRMPIAVNTAGSYAFGGSVQTGADDSLADFFQSQLPYETGPQNLQVTFRGTDIARNGVLLLGDPARVQVDALNDVYELVATTSKSLSVPASAFEGLGVQMSLGTTSVTTGQDLRIPVTLTHTARGGSTYAVQVILLNASDFSYIAYESREVTLPASASLNVNFDIDGTDVYQFMDSRGIASTEFYVYAYLVDVESYEIHLSVEQATGTFLKSSFPAPPVRFGSPLTATAVDTDATPDGLYDELRVGVPLVVDPAMTPASYYASVVVFGPGFSYITGNWESFEVAPGTTQIPLDVTSFPGRHFSSKAIDGPYTAYVSLYDAEWNFVGYEEVTSPSYLASQFDTGGVRITSVSATTSGIARPGGPGYDGIRVTPGLAVTSGASGDYYAYALVYTASWNFVGYDFREVSLDETTTAGEFLIPADQIRLSGANGMYRYVVTYYDQGSWDAVATRSGFLGSYNSADFRVSGFEFGNPSQFTDAAVDGSTKLRLTANVNVGDAGTYKVYSVLYTNNWQWVGYTSRDVTFTASDVGAAGRVVEMDFDAVDILAVGSQGPFRAYFYAYDASWNFIDYTRNAQTTGTYPLASWAIQSSIDLQSLATETTTLTSGKVASIEQAVTYDVNQAGTYTLSAVLLADAGGFPVQVAGAEQTVTYSASEVGAGKTATFSFDAEDIRLNLPPGFNGAFTVEVKALRAANFRSQLVETLERTTTGTYTLSSFVTPTAAASIVSYTWTPLDRTPGGANESLRVSVTLNVASAGTLRLDADLYGPGGARYVASATTTGTVLAGTQTLDLEFSGASIRTAGADGVYRLGSVYLYGAEGSSFNLIERARNVESPTTLSAFNFN